jgi:hypothetical protein
MQKLIQSCVTAFALLCVTGCAVHREVTVIDSRSDIVRLGKGVKGPVYTQDKDGKWIDRGIMVLPEGWFAGALD